MFQRFIFHLSPLTSPPLFPFYLLYLHSSVTTNLHHLSLFCRKTLYVHSLFPPFLSSDPPLSPSSHADPHVCLPFSCPATQICIQAIKSAIKHCHFIAERLDRHWYLHIPHSTSGIALTGEGKYWVMLLGIFCTVLTALTTSSFFYCEFRANS